MKTKNTKMNVKNASHYELDIKRIIEIEVTIANYKHQDILEVIDDLDETLQSLAEVYDFRRDGFESGGDWYASYFHLPTENEFDAIAKAYSPAWELAESIRKNVRIKQDPEHPLRIVARYLVTKYDDDGEVTHDYFPFIVSTTKDLRYGINDADGPHDEPYVLI